MTAAPAEAVPDGMLEITFRGLFLFAPSPDGCCIHVFAAQPNGHSHVTRRRFPDGSGRYTAEDVAPETLLEYGESGHGAVTMPPPDQMSSFSSIPGGHRIPKEDAKPGKAPGSGAHDPRGPHIKLTGGALTVDGEIGKWRDRNHPGSEYRFPYMLIWRGKAKTKDPVGELQLWNAMHNEVPPRGRNSEIPRLNQNAQEAAAAAALHFQAYYEITKNAGPPDLEYYDFIKPAASGIVRMDTLLVVSCPAGGGGLS